LAESTSTSENPPKISERSTVTGIIGRVTGWSMDILLLAIFLILGVAFLDVIVQLIVFITGFFQKPPADLLALGIEEWDPKRHQKDAILIVQSVLITLLAFFTLMGGLRFRRYLFSKIVDARFASFVGKRYLLTRHGNSLANLITGVSVLGVTVGVMALVVVISVMNGFDRELMNKFIGVFSHVEIWPAYANDESEFSHEEYERIVAAVEEVDGVVGSAPLIQRQTFFQADTGISRDKYGGVLRGIDVEREKNVTRLTENVTPEGVVPGDREVVLGHELAKKLYVTIGDEIYAFGGKLVTTARGPTGKISKFRVVGVFRTGLHDIDSSFAYTNVSTVQNLYLTGDRITTVHLALEDPFEASRKKAEILSSLPERKLSNGGYRIRTWEELNPDFFAALKTEKIAMFIILTLIIIVAALNIIGTLVMVVTQKTREIGILKSMGASSAMIMRIFLFHGFFVGLVGTAMGVCCGLWLCRFVHNDIEKIFELPAAVYGLDRLPVIVDPLTIGVIAFTSLVICTAAGIVPSLLAARKDPVESLRYT